MKSSLLLINCLFILSCSVGRDFKKFETKNTTLFYSKKNNNLTLKAPGKIHLASISQLNLKPPVMTTAQFLKLKPKKSDIAKKKSQQIGIYQNLGIKSKDFTAFATARLPSAVLAPPRDVQNYRTRIPIAGKMAVVIDEFSGRILYAKNPYQLVPIASIQKLLTAMVAIDYGLLVKNLRVARSDTLVEPTKLGLRSGEVYNGAKLLEAMLVRSGNDAARCIARNVVGNEAKFAHLMTLKARSLGLKYSIFKNASGLSEKGQYSSAFEAAIIARAAKKYPFIRNTIRKKAIYFYTLSGKRKYFKNTNKLLKKFPLCNGIKTGYTKASGRTLASSAYYNGRSVIAVVLKSTTSSIWRDSEKLLRFGLDL